MSEAIIVSVIGPLVGMAAGGLITWWVARRYYEKASDDLVAEAVDLRLATDRVLRYLEAHHQGEPDRDASPGESRT